MNDVILNKIQSIQRCVKRAREEYGRNTATFDADFTRQDAALLNVLRAREQGIDLANHVIKMHRFGIPTTSSEGFDLLQQHAVIDAALAGKLKRMVQFRNIVVHQYQQVQIEFVRAAIETGLDDLVALGDCILRFERGNLD